MTTKENFFITSATTGAIASLLAIIVYAKRRKEHLLQNAVDELESLSTYDSGNFKIVSKNGAKDIALKDAGLKSEDVDALLCTVDTNGSGDDVYVVKFRHQDRKHKYVISVLDGIVIEHNIKHIFVQS